MMASKRRVSSSAASGEESRTRTRRRRRPRRRRRLGMRERRGWRRRKRAVGRGQRARGGRGPSRERVGTRARSARGRRARDTHRTPRRARRRDCAWSRPWVSARSPWTDGAARGVPPSERDSRRVKRSSRVEERASLGDDYHFTGQRGPNPRQILISRTAEMGRSRLRFSTGCEPISCDHCWPAASVDDTLRTPTWRASPCPPLASVAVTHPATAAPSFSIARAPTGVSGVGFILAPCISRFRVICTTDEPPIPLPRLSFRSIAPRVRPRVCDPRGSPPSA